MSWTQIGENYWVSPQISEQQVSQAKQEGFEVIVCNRPDGESADQVPMPIIKAAAEAQDIEYLFLPMNGPIFSENDAQQVQQLLKDGKKVLAYCRSGHRSSVLFNAAAS